MELIENLEQIESHKDLSRFVEKLHLDYLNNPDSWENSDLASFLQAMAAFVEDIDGYYKNTKQIMPDQKVWRTFARILYASKIYE